MRHAISNENRIDPLTACPTCGRPLVDDFAHVAGDHDRYEIHAGDKIVRLPALAATVFQIAARSSNGYSDARSQSCPLNVGGSTSARSWRDIEAGEDEE